LSVASSSSIPNHARLERHFDTLFTTDASIDALKRTILDLSVRGKLVEQDAGDEAASILLKRIQAERVKLLGGRKASKLPNVATSHGKLPNGWACTPLVGIGITMTGGTPKSAQPGNFEGLVPFIGPGQISPAGTILPIEKTISEDGLCQSTESLPGDILMVCIGGSIGKSAITQIRMGYNQQINAVRTLIADNRYVALFLQSSNFQNDVLERATGSATPIINRTKWEEIPISVPPLAEQRRIVAKVDALMALCDALKARLADAAQTQRHLADAITQRAAA
jgi:type I restriction enzyme S subunit